MDCSEGCPTAAVMFGVPGVRVLAAERDGGGLLLTVETDRQVEGCHGCGVLAVPHGRREVRALVVGARATLLRPVRPSRAGCRAT
jgi:hypothetical protein